MALNLLDLAKTYLMDAVVEPVSQHLGEDQSTTQTALSGALPVVLSRLVQRSTEPGGTSSVMDLMAEITTPNRATGETVIPQGSILSHLTALLNGSPGQLDNLLSMGSGMMASLFGDKADSVAGALATHSGVKPSSASSLLSLAGPVLLGVLGQKMADDDGGPNNLASLLSGQVEHVQSAMPSGLMTVLSSIPGLGLLSDTTGRVPDVLADGPVIRPTGTLSDVNPTARPVTASTPTYSDEDTRRAASGNRWLPWLFLLLGVAALIYFVRGCGNDARQMDDRASATADSVNSRTNEAAASVETAADTAGSTIGAAMDSAGDAVSDATARLGAFFKRKLPTGFELNIPEKGIENNLVQFIEDKNRPVDKETWFNFGRLLFDTGKATLKPNTKDEVNNIAEILKAYPNVNIKIGGYTDNTGDAKANQKLSQERANTVLKELVALGIGKARLEAEGYGSEHPAASNDTEAGRAENRRIAVRVTKK